MALGQQQQNEAAWEALKPIIEDSKVPPMALLFAAKSLGELKRYDEAIPLMERFLEIEPNAADVRKQLELMREKASSSSE